MSNIAIPDEPIFKLEMEETTEETPGSYEVFNPRFARLLENEAFLKNAICKCEKTEALPAGQTSAVFNFDEGSIGENSKISLEASVPDVSYENIAVDGDSVTVTFEAQEKDIYVKAVVSDAMV